MPAILWDYVRPSAVGRCPISGPYFGIVSPSSSGPDLASEFGQFSLATIFRKSAIFGDRWTTIGPPRFRENYGQSATAWCDPIPNPNLG